MFDDAFLQRLIDTYDTPEVTAFGLSGSYARGDAHAYSDVDLVRYVRDESSLGYTVGYVEGKLVTVTSVTLAQKRADMHKPGSAIWVVSALHRMRILLDKEGGLAQLQQDSQSFKWDRAQANAHASDYLAGCAEEVHKLLGGFERKDEPALVYATMGLLLSLTHTMAVAHNLLVSTENAYFREVGAVIGSASPWTRQLNAALGLGEDNSVYMRAQAALRLFRETARLLEPILCPEDLQVVHTCITLLAQHTIGD